MTERLHFHFSLSCIGGANGNPLQCSCLENPKDGGPGGLPSMGSHRVGHDWSDPAAAAAAAIFTWPSFIAAPAHLHPRPQCRKTSCLPRLPHHFNFVELLEDGHSEGCALIPRCSFDGHFSNTDANHLFLCSMAIWMPAEDKGLFRPLAYFSIDWFLMLSWMNCLHVFGDE